MRLDSEYFTQANFTRAVLEYVYIILSFALFTFHPAMKISPFQLSYIVKNLPI